MQVLPIQNYSQKTNGLKEQGNRMSYVMDSNKNLAKDSFIKGKVDSTSFKGTRHIVEATVGTAVASIGATAATTTGVAAATAATAAGATGLAGALAGAITTVAAAPVAIPVLIIGGLFVGLHGVFNALDD